MNGSLFQLLQLFQGMRSSIPCAIMISCNACTVPERQRTLSSRDTVIHRQPDVTFACRFFCSIKIFLRQITIGK